MIPESSTIERCPHDPENPYLQVSRALIRDKSISPECRLLIIYLLANKDNWRINTKQLINEFKEHMGRDRVYEILNEAIEAGYMIRESVLTNGTFTKGAIRLRYRLSESPKFKKILLRPEPQDHGRQDHEIPHTKEEPSSKHKYKKKDQYKREGDPPPLPPKSQKSSSILEKGRFVRLSSEEFERLCAEHGVGVIEGVIACMNDYLASTGKRPYKDFAAAIRNWIRKERKWNNKGDETSWKKNNYQPTPGNSNHISSDSSMTEQILVPLSSILDMRCSSNPGLMEEKEPSS